MFMWKRILIITLCCLAIGGIIFGCYHLERQQQAENERQSAQLAQKVQPLAERKNALQNQLRQLENEHRQALLGQSCVIPVFTSTTESLYNVAYPLLKKYGYGGVMVFQNGHYAGDPGQLTKAQYKTLLSQGFETALGDTSDIRLSENGQDNAVFKQWTAYLDAALQEMEKRGMTAPKVYYFDQKIDGVSKTEVVNALRARGFEGMFLPKSDEEILQDSTEFNGFHLIGFKRIYDNGSTVNGLFSQMNQNGIVTAVSTRELTESITDSNLDCSVTRYEKMLNAVKNTYSGLTCKSYSGFRAYRAALSASSTKENQSYEQKRKELRAEIADLESQITRQSME